MSSPLYECFCIDFELVLVSSFIRSFIEWMDGCFSRSSPSGLLFIHPSFLSFVHSFFHLFVPIPNITHRNYIIQQPQPFFSEVGVDDRLLSATLIAWSNTSFRPFCVFAEHSK